MKQPNGLFFRNYKNGKASIPGFLDDQVFMIEALIETYRSSWNEDYLLKAKKIMELIIEFYYDEKSGGFFYAAKDQPQPVLRTKEVTDNVIPSANSAMANMLFLLGHYFYNEEWIKLSRDLCIQIKNKALKYGPYFSNWANAILLHTHGGIEVAITGPIDHAKIKELYKVPGLILMHKKQESTVLPLLKDKPQHTTMQIYICKDKTCGLPVGTIDEALIEIQKIQEGNSGPR